MSVRVKPKAADRATPRQVRQGLKSGEWAADQKAPIYPPEEWPEWRRKRMEVAVTCAAWFIIHDKEWHSIAKQLAKKKMADKVVTKQRVNQYVQKGMNFLIQRGALKKVA